MKKIIHILACLPVIVIAFVALAQDKASLLAAMAVLLILISGGLFVWGLANLMADL